MFFGRIKNKQEKYRQIFSQIYNRDLGRLIFIFFEEKIEKKENQSWEYFGTLSRCFFSPFTFFFLFFRVLRNRPFVARKCNQIWPNDYVSCTMLHETAIIF